MLSEEDKRLWRKITRTVTPKAQMKSPTREDFAAMMRVPAPGRPTQPSSFGPLEIDQSKATRRGRVNIDAKIDLHDLTLAEAQPALYSALIRAHDRGARVVLVVTGKGPQLRGKIRTALPGWLASGLARPLVATYAPAHIRHGGSGAWYVFLRR